MKTAESITTPTPPTPSLPMTPAGRYLPTPQADAWTPLAQAVTGAALVATAIVACGLAITIWFQIAPGQAIGVLGLLWLVVASILAAVLYFRQLARVQRTWWDIELARGVDLNGDGVIGPPAHGMIVNQPPADPAAVMMRKTDDLLRAIYERNNTTYRAVRALCPDLTLSEYEEIRDRLIQAGLAQWVGHGRAHGWRPAPGLTCDLAQQEARRRIVWLKNST